MPTKLYKTRHKTVAVSAIMLRGSLMLTVEALKLPDLYKVCCFAHVIPSITRIPAAWRNCGNEAKTTTH